LLDPFMESLAKPVLLKIRAHRDSCRALQESSQDFVLALFQLVYFICKVRGHKTVGASFSFADARPPASPFSPPLLLFTVRFFPHEIVDLEPTFSYLAAYRLVAFALQFCFSCCH